MLEIWYPRTMLRTTIEFPSPLSKLCQACAYRILEAGATRVDPEPASATLPTPSLVPPLLRLSSYQRRPLTTELCSIASLSSAIAAPRQRQIQQQEEDINSERHLPRHCHKGNVLWPPQPAGRARSHACQERIQQRITFSTQAAEQSGDGNIASSDWGPGSQQLSKSLERLLLEAFNLLQQDKADLAEQLVLDGAPLL